MRADKLPGAVLALILAVSTLSLGAQAPPGTSEAAPKEAQQPPAAQPPPAHSQDDVSPDDLPEEDESLKPKVYAFNPLEAERNIKVGSFYMHKKSTSGYRAAVGRFEEATKYNPGSAEAFFRLGEAEEKLKHAAKAKAAFARVLAISPDSKLAKDAKKKLASLG